MTEVTVSGVQPSYTTLYHLALTCQTFRELALDALWAHIQASYVLVMCLPQGAHSPPIELIGGDISMLGISICRSDMAVAGNMVRLLRPLVDDDRAAFQKYARKRWPVAMADLLAGVSKACPKIKELRCSTPPASACTMLSDIVTCWDDLEILEMGAVNAQALKHLASLKQLRELKMLVPEGYSLEPTLPFSVIFSVGTISMTAPKVKLLLAFLAPLQLSAKSAQLNIETTPNAVDLCQLLSSLTEHFKFNVLESLNVGVARPTDFADHAVFELTASALRGLRAFAGLTNLNLSSMHISITDDEILDLVSAWPQMKHLYLDTDWSREVTRLGVTFLGLAGVLERCPKLRSLGINLDTTAPSHTHHQTAGITSEQLTDLRVGYAECNDVEVIGNLLAGMCPNLSHIYCTRPVNPDYEDFSTDHPWFEGAGTWKKVEDVISQRRMKQRTQRWHALYSHVVVLSHFPV
ncbi:hypothetical protein BDR03DRAFT_980625 [Suillus americanus]|nr:hypothetical protein BDR03DRAFT_980625 [Suillus americanus]